MIQMCDVCEGVGKVGRDWSTARTCMGCDGAGVYDLIVIPDDLSKLE